MSFHVKKPLTLPQFTARHEKEAALGILSTNINQTIEDSDISPEVAPME
jgi:hypothetical protein